VKTSNSTKTWTKLLRTESPISLHLSVLWSHFCLR